MRTWDHWHFNDLDQRFGDKWPGQIPAQLVAHTLFYFTKEGDLVFDPMAGGGVVADARIAFLNSDWRDFQGVAAMEEDPDLGILLPDYIEIMKRSGWEITHIIDCPLSTQRFKPNQVRRMQKNRTLGVIRRSLIIGRKK